MAAKIQDGRQFSVKKPGTFVPLMAVIEGQFFFLNPSTLRAAARDSEILFINAINDIHLIYDRGKCKRIEFF
jgi:hypothetical protein